MDILVASEAHIDAVAELFDLYRQFYQQPPNPVAAREFISARIGNGESTIFLAVIGHSPAGFVQLYPSFCSVDAVKRLILYDLYVDEAFRKRGVARCLMNRARQLAVDVGAARIDLETAHDNLPGRALYEQLGYVRSGEEFRTYSLEIAAPTAR